MDFISRPLKKEDIKQAARLDRMWFGEYGTSEEDLKKYIEKYPVDSIAILEGANLVGFATFELVHSSMMPRDYVGNISQVGKALFLSNFTTLTNYKKDDWSKDKALLDAIEQKAKYRGCSEVWEALSQDHPYKKENNPDFDAYGFYLSHGFTVDKERPLTWQPNSEISIPCFLFRKAI